MRPRKPGKTLCLALAFLSLNACRSSQPPALSLVCIGDGVGGADCVDHAGNKIYKTPSELLNFWMTTETDEQNFAQWCYGASSPAPIKAGMTQIMEKIR